MSEIARIKRSISRADAACASLSIANDVSDQQKAWEDFLASWRTALNQIATLSSRRKSILERDMRIEREGSPTLLYVWEARNAEEHTPEGTSDIYLERVPKEFTFGGQPFTFGGEPFTISLPEEKLSFRALKIRNGSVLIPPAGPIFSVAAEALEYLHKAYDRLIADRSS